MVRGLPSAALGAGRTRGKQERFASGREPVVLIWRKVPCFGSSAVIDRASNESQKSAEAVIPAEHQKVCNPPICGIGLRRPSVRFIEHWRHLGLAGALPFDQEPARRQASRCMAPHSFRSGEAPIPPL